jgi:TRAP-type uncharacterized transport system fused permease subunit
MLLIDSHPFEVVQIVVTSLIGIFGISAALEGYCFTEINPVFRILVIVGGLLLIIPGLVTDATGLALVIGVLAIQKLLAVRKTAAAA